MLWLGEGGMRNEEDLILLGYLGHAGGLGAADASVAVAVGAEGTRWGGLIFSGWAMANVWV